MKGHLLILVCFCVCISAYGQESQIHDYIPQGVVVVNDEAFDRAGSCASPNGPILCPALASPPTYGYLNTNGYCYSISPAVKNATYCYTFTSPGTTVMLNAGFSTTGIGGYSYYFDNFYLYTCAPSCTMEPAYITPYFTWTGLTAGQCYTFCFDTHYSGGGPSGGFTSMCPYFIYTAPLPIELAAFTAYSESGIVQLNWSTETETNCMEFRIERSADGVNFETIGIVNGSGTTTTARDYLFTDLQPAGEMNYYRLRQIDYDYASQLSDIISCKVNTEPATHYYFTLSGQMINIDDAPSGLYLHEIVSGNSSVRELLYHAR